MDKTGWNIVVMMGSYSIGILVMLILPLFSVPGYSITGNTLGELGAQSTPSELIMNLVLLILTLCSGIAGWRYFEEFILHRIILLLFSVSLTSAVFINLAPVNSGILTDLKEAGWHLFFAGTAILSFTILSISTGFILEKQVDRILSVGTGISIIFLSLLISEAEKYAGIWQRLMYVISFGWIIYLLKTREL